VAVLSIGGTAAFLHTWTNAFAWDNATVACGCMEMAVKDSTGAETLSTAETWDTARTSRIALAVYGLQSSFGRRKSRPPPQSPPRRWT
jgi:hypothetical protein